MCTTPPSFFLLIDWKLCRYSRHGLKMCVIFSSAIYFSRDLDVVIFGGFLKSRGHKLAEFACYYQFN